MVQDMDLNILMFHVRVESNEELNRIGRPDLLISEKILIHSTESPVRRGESGEQLRLISRNDEIGVEN